MKVWLFLVIAILAEVIATSCLKSSEGFTRLLPSLATITGYAIAFFFLSLALKTIPVGIAYAVWSGVGIVLISTIGWLLFKQSLDNAALLGMALILSGVLIINLFSTSTA